MNKIKTVFYFVRHAQPDYNNHDDMERPLTEKGLRDRSLVDRFLADKGIDVVVSSPYKRSVDTVKSFAEARGLDIQIVEDFRERCIDNVWIDNFDEFAKKQWEDFDYKLSGGESLREVQERNIAALKDMLKLYSGKNIAAGSHGTAMSVIINYFDQSFGYDEFDKIKGAMPWIAAISFDGDDCTGIEKVDLI